MTRWLGGVVLAFAIGGLGCEDDAGSTIIVEDIDGSVLDPDPPSPDPEGDPEPEPEPDGDPNGADAGGHDDADAAIDEGGTIEGDSGDGRPPPVTTPDAGPEPPEEHDAGAGDDGGFSLPGDEEPDIDEPIFDGQPLRMPGCGMIDPGRAVSAGPAALSTWIHGAPAFRFDEPALAGCRPDRLWAGVAGGFRQDITFTYSRERLIEWRWLLGTPDGGSAADAAIWYDGTGRVARAEYRCPWGAGTEIHTFAHDRHGRLVQSRLDRPVRCRADGEPALRRTTTWRYADPDDVLPASRTTEDERRGPDDVDAQAGAARAMVDLEYSHDAAGRLVEVREFGADGRVTAGRSLSWAGDRVVRQVIRWLPVAANRDGELAEAGFDYAYDRQGRLVERRGEGTHLRLAYALDGEVETIETTNTEALRTMGYPEVSVFDRIGLLDDPESEIGRRR